MFTTSVVSIRRVKSLLPWFVEIIDLKSIISTNHINNKSSSMVSQSHRNISDTWKALFGNHCSTIRTILLIIFTFVVETLFLLQKCLYNSVRHDTVVSAICQMANCIQSKEAQVRDGIEPPSQDLQSHTLAFMLPNLILSYNRFSWKEKKPSFILTTGLEPVIPKEANFESAMFTISPSE